MPTAGIRSPEEGIGLLMSSADADARGARGARSPRPPSASAARAPSSSAARRVIGPVAPPPPGRLTA